VLEIGNGELNEVFLLLLELEIGEEECLDLVEVVSSPSPSSSSSSSSFAGVLIDVVQLLPIGSIRDLEACLDEV
jgi:hypothetical protein